MIVHPRRSVYPSNGLSNTLTKSWEQPGEHYEYTTIQPHAIFPRWARSVATYIVNVDASDIHEGDASCPALRANPQAGVGSEENRGQNRAKAMADAEAKANDKTKPPRCQSRAKAKPCQAQACQHKPEPRRRQSCANAKLKPS